MYSCRASMELYSMKLILNFVWPRPHKLHYIYLLNIYSCTMAKLSKRSTRKKSRKPSTQTKRPRTRVTRKRRKTRKSRIAHKGGSAEWIDKSIIDPSALPGHQVKTFNGTAGTGTCRNASGQIYSCPELDPTNMYYR